MELVGANNSIFCFQCFLFLSSVGIFSPIFSKVTPSCIPNIEIYPNDDNRTFQARATTAISPGELLKFVTNSKDVTSHFKNLNNFIKGLTTSSILSFLRPTASSSWNLDGDPSVNVSVVLTQRRVEPTWDPLLVGNVKLVTLFLILSALSQSRSQLPITTGSIVFVLTLIAQPIHARTWWVLSFPSILT